MAVNVTMQGMLYTAGQGLSIGSPVSHGMQDVVYKDSIMQNCLTGVRIKAQRAHGGELKGLRWESIEFQSVGIMISVETDYKHTGVVSENPPLVNDVVQRNISYSWDTVAGLFFCVLSSSLFFSQKRPSLRNALGHF
jgi:polygalacturonase